MKAAPFISLGLSLKKGLRGHTCAWPPALPRVDVPRFLVWPSSREPRGAEAPPRVSRGHSLWQQAPEKEAAATGSHRQPHSHVRMGCEGLRARGGRPGSSRASGRVRTDRQSEGEREGAAALAPSTLLSQQMTCTLTGGGGGCHLDAHRRVGS